MNGLDDQQIASFNRPTLIVWQGIVLSAFCPISKTSLTTLTPNMGTLDNFTLNRTTILTFIDNFHFQNATFTFRTQLLLYVSHLFARS